MRAGVAGEGDGSDGEINLGAAASSMTGLFTASNAALRGEAIAAAETATAAKPSPGAAIWVGGLSFAATALEGCGSSTVIEPTRGTPAAVRAG
jgi:hypothetical protein